MCSANSIVPAVADFVKAQAGHREGRDMDHAEGRKRQVRRIIRQMEQYKALAEHQDPVFRFSGDVFRYPELERELHRLWPLQAALRWPREKRTVLMDLAYRESGSEMPDYAERIGALAGYGLVRLRAGRVTLTDAGRHWIQQPLPVIHREGDDCGE